MLTTGQMKAARALLGWRQADLALRSGVSEVTVKNIERGATDARGSTLDKIQRAIEDGGVEFISGSVRGGEGVKLKESR